MVLKINEAFVTCIMVTDENNNPATGKTINYRIFDETYSEFATGSMTEISNYGIYYVSWTPDAEGYWIFEAYYLGSDFRFYDVKMYQVGKGIEDDIFDNIGTPVHSTISGDIADLISRTKGLDDIYDAVTGGGTPPADIWNYATRTLTDPNSYKADVSSLALEATLGTHDTDIKALLAIVQADLDNPNQYKADVSALALEATLTAMKGGGWTNETLKAIKDAIDALNNLSASGVWNYGTRTLTDPNSYKADVSALALEATLGTHDTDIKALLATIQADLDNPNQYKANVSALALEATLATHDTEVKVEIDANETKIDNLDADLVTHATALGTHDTDIKADIADLDSDLVTHATALGTHDTDIKALLATVQADLDNPNQYKANVSALALEASLATHDTEVKAEIDANEAKIDNLDADLIAHATALATHDTAIKALLEHGTYGLAALNTDLDAIISALTTIQTDLDNPNQYKADVSALALEATLSTHDTDIKADIGDFSGQANLQSLLEALGIPDVSGKSLYVCLITDRLDNATFGLNALKTEIDANETKIDDLDSDLVTHATALGTHDTDIKALINALNDPTALAIADAVWDEATSGHVGAGSFGKLLADLLTESQSHPTLAEIEAGDMTSILADTGELQTDWADGGRLDLLIDAILADTGELQTDWADGGRLDLLIDAILADTATIVWTDITALENKIKASPSVDSIFFKSGGATCPASKSIWDALGDGTVDLNDLFDESKGLKQVYDLTDQLFNLKRIGDTITTDGTEQTLFIIDDPEFPLEMRKVIIDLTNSTGTETIVVRVYYRIKDGGSLIEQSETTYTGDQDPDLKVIELEPNLFGVQITIEKTAGTNRDYDYEVYFEER